MWVQTEVGPTRFACLDDKHEVKVGELCFPVVAAEHG